MKRICDAVTAALLVLAMLSPAMAETADPEASFPVQLAYDRVTAGDLDGAMSHLTGDAVYVVIPSPRGWSAPALSGREAIGAWWRGMHADNGSFVVANLVMDGERATFDGYYDGDRLRKIGMSPAEFDGVAVLRDGKVQALLVSYKADYAARLRAAMSKAD